MQGIYEYVLAVFFVLLFLVNGRDGGSLSTLDITGVIN